MGNKLAAIRYNFIMKFIGFFLFLIFTTACGGQTVENQKLTEDRRPKTEDRAKPLVLVELFTSEG